MNNMKKKLWICAAAASLLLLAGCAEAGKTAPETTAVPTASPAPTATPAPVSPEAAAESGRAELTAFSDYAAVYAALSSEQSTAQERAETLSAAVYADLTRSDAVRVDGSYIYALSDKTLTIFRLGDGTGETVSTTLVGTPWSSEDNGAGEFSGSERIPVSIFLNGSYLAVIQDVYSYDSAGGSMHYAEYVGVDIYDVSDPSAPSLIASGGQDGVFTDAWMSSGTLCVASAYSVTDPADASDTDAYVPRVYSASSSASIQPSELYALSSGGADCAVLGAYSLNEGVQKNAVAVYGADTKDMYPVTGGVILTQTRTVSAESRRMSDENGAFTEYAELACTDLFRFDYDYTGIRLAASGIVNGLLPDKNAVARLGGEYVCLSESSGSYLRLYDGKGGPVPAAECSGSTLYVLDASLTVTAGLDMLPGGERIVWAGFTPDAVLLSGETASCRADLSVPGTVTAIPAGDAVRADALLSWRDGGYAAFRQEASGTLVLSLYDSSLKKTAERTFGSDFSSTLESLQSYFALPEKNLLGFAADDSYCLYAENGGEIEYCASIFLSDWAWNSRAFAQDGYLYIVDRREALVYTADTLENTASFPF